MDRQQQGTAIGRGSLILHTALAVEILGLDQVGNPGKTFAIGILVTAQRGEQRDDHRRRCAQGTAGRH